MQPESSLRGWSWDRVLLLVLAVLASSVVGLVIDSVLFLWLAFGSLDYVAGQIVGKLWMVLLALPFIHWVRKRELALRTILE